MLRRTDVVGTVDSMACHRTFSNRHHMSSTGNEPDNTIPVSLALSISLNSPVGFSKEVFDSWYDCIVVRLACDGCIEFKFCLVVITITKWAGDSKLVDCKRVVHQN